MEPERVIIIDSNPKFVSLVREVLTDGGFGVMAANNGERAIKMVAVEQPDLMILDITLKGTLDGFEVTQRIREFSDIPIIVMSDNDSPDDILRVFEAGADDFVQKPFNSKVLLARLKAILKRCYHSTPVHTESEIVCDRLKINLLCRKVTIDDVEIYLAETEYNLLVELARHCNEVLLHEQLLTSVWGPKYLNEIDYLRSYVHILRRKLEANPMNPKMIISKPGVGYMLVSSPINSPGE